MTSQDLINRKQALMALLEFEDSLELIRSELRKFDWDSEESCAECKRKHMINVLTRYQNGEISSSKLEEWANLVECREDIDFEHGWENLLSEIVFQLANPELEGDFTKSDCRSWIERLSRDEPMHD